ncbi:MAG: DsrE family protein [Thiovulaceae bacterium]|nr:DsrE family protein [Sulfurimonadaceae bacterium]
MNKLLVVWSTEEEEVAKKMVLMYCGVALPRGYWDEVHLMVWGPSTRLLAKNSELQEMVHHIEKTGVKLSACSVCSDSYDVSNRLKALNIDVTHTGELLTQALQEDWKVITF